MRGRGKRIVAFPRDGIAYLDCFYAAAEALGAVVVPGEWAGRWFLDNVNRGDVVHLHWPSFYYSEHGQTGLGPIFRFTYLLLLLRFRGARIVWTAHNLYPHDNGPRSRAHRYVRKLIVALSEFILVHGKQAQRIVRDEFAVPERKFCVIHHGHWMDYYPREIDARLARERLGIAPETFVFGFVGLCKPYKNLEGLISAFSKGPKDSSLLIAGSFQSQEYREHIERLLAALDPARVIFRPGFIKDEDLQVYVRAASVLVNPFTDILTSGSAMLALSFGRPVVAPQLGSMPEIITESCGVLYDPTRPDGLLQAMNSARVRHFDDQVIVDHAATYDWKGAASPFLDALAGASPQRRTVAG